MEGEVKRQMAWSRGQWRNELLMNCDEELEEMCIYGRKQALLFHRTRYRCIISEPVLAWGGSSFCW
jgi:hypothetical protein